MTNEYIEEICKLHNIRNYTINDDKSIDVTGNISFFSNGITELPLNFNKVDGDFDLSFNNLTTLKGIPKEVNSLYLVHNELTRLDYVPEIVKTHLDLSFNKLTDMKDLNRIKSIGTLNLGANKITNLYDIPNVEHKFNCSETPVGQLYKFSDIYDIKTFNMLKIIKGNEVNLQRLKYFYSLMEQSFNVEIDKLDKSYKIV